VQPRVFSNHGERSASTGGIFADQGKIVNFASSGIVKVGEMPFFFADAPQDIRERREVHRLV